MKFSLGVLSIEFGRPVTSPRRGARPPALTPYDKFVRAEKAAYWILNRYLAYKPHSRRRRPRDMTEQSWNHGMNILRMCGFVYQGKWHLRRKQSAAEQDKTFQQLYDTCEWLMTQMDDDKFVAPWG